MSEFKKWQTILKIVLIVAIIGGIMISIATRGVQEEQEESVYEKIFKISAFFMIALILIMYWVLPNTKIAKHFKMNESLFIASHILGMVCGVIGLTVTFLWKQMVIKIHLFEFMVILFGIIFVYWAMILKARKSVKISDILDEKQMDNIRGSAAVTLSVVTGIMLMMYFFSYHGVFVIEGKVWFLFYFFMTLFIYSVSTLYYFKKE
ncbi:MAG: hypothetical protein R6V00_08535 [Candidatus Aminicenantes bacterium]